MKTESKQQILKRRKEIEQELIEMLKETESDFTLNHVRDVIYNEEDNDDMMKVVAMFDRGGDASELSSVLELVTDAWNYFPHKVLGGISPAEKLLEHKDKNI
jgi:Ran GTPase-activating protein (RanGAP) involved in mRNA processing and transport